MNDPRQPPALLEVPQLDPQDSAQPDPRDGAEPPALPTDSPANPRSLAILLSGNPAVTDAQVESILGAPIAQLLRDKQSVLYAKGKAPVGSSAKRPAGAVERPGEVVLIQGGTMPGKARPTAPPVTPPVTPPSVSAKSPGAPFLARLQLAGVGCAEWARMNFLERARAVRHVFYDTSRPGLPGDVFQLPPLPKNPDDLIPAIDDACGVTSAPAPAKTPQAVPSIGGARAVDWFLSELQRGGVGCAAWASMSPVARLNTVRNFFYAATPPAQTRAEALLQAQRNLLRPYAAPEQPQELVAAIDEACQVAAPANASITAPSSSSGALVAWAIDVWNRLGRIGVTCDQWFARDRYGQWLMLDALRRQGMLPNYPSGDWEQSMEALDRECLNRAAPASNSPTDSIRARVRAILDCAALDAQDKLQQITVILRAFPEFNTQRDKLYRLALARYDGCHPAGEAGWAGQNFTIAFRAGTQVRTLANGADWIQQLQQAGRDDDVFEGDVRGMSLMQWVRQGPYMPPSGPDVFDPVQGAIGDCYLIAAMAAMAWTRPNELAQLGRPLANGRRQYRLGERQVEVSERTPCMILAGFAPLFARGSRLDAQWPGVLEKAFAARETNDTTDRPDILAIDNMGPTPTFVQTAQVGASAIRRSLDALPNMTGGRLFWHLTYFRSANGCWGLILNNYCDRAGRARVPMVAATYEAGGFVDRTGLAAQHVYSVLGVGIHVDGRKFVVLRNPWGHSSHGLPAAGFTVPVVGRWLNRLSLNNGDGGCFAIAHGAFAAAFRVFYGAE